jgi:ABC-type multidrug transport system ATPase subunit
MIRLSGITQLYGVRPVLRNLDLEISDAGVTAIVGPNGMGKTTLMSVLAGVLTPQEGTGEINGLIRRSTPEDELEIRRQAVFLPDRPWLPKQRTGREFLLSVGALYGIETERLIDHVERLFQLFNLAKEADWPVRSYSNGQQKKLSLSAALVTEARILLLDEPFGGGLDPAGILALKHVLLRLTRQQDYCVVLTAPAPELIEELADRFVVLREGRIVAHDTIEGLRKETGLGGPLSDVLASLISPETMDHVEEYFAGESS